MDIGIIGSGVVGKTLGAALSARGHAVVIGTRDEGKLREWAAKTGGRARMGSFADAAAHGEMVMNAASGRGSLEALRSGRCREPGGQDPHRHFERLSKKMNTPAFNIRIVTIGGRGMITRVSHMTLYVRDQKQACDVYVNKLGFKVSTDRTMENGVRWLTVTPPGQPDVEIVLAEPRAPMVRADLLQHVKALLDANAMGSGVWECDNCQETYEAMKNKGIEFMKPPTKESYGIEALFRDGCGNWFSMTEHEKK